jgi:hypothetical protein
MIMHDGETLRTAMRHLSRIRGYDSRIGSMSAFAAGTLLRLLVEPGEHRLAIVTSAEVVALETEADCDSETWFADIMVGSGQMGGSIRNVSLISTSSPSPFDHRSRRRFDKQYGIKIITTDGTLIFCIATRPTGITLVRSR